MGYSRRFRSYRIVRLYQSDRGVWRYEAERDGELRWASLHTRDEAKARRMFDRMRADIEEWSKNL